MRDNAKTLQRLTVPNCCVSLFFCVAFDIVSDVCAENLNDDSEPGPVITLQTSDMANVTPDQTVTLSSGTSSITARFGSSQAGIKFKTTLTAVILSVDATPGSPPMTIRLDSVTFSNGTTAQDIGEVNSTGPTTGMFRLGALGKEPVDALVFSVPDIIRPQNASSVDVVVQFNGCIETGEYNLLSIKIKWFPYVNRPHGQHHFPHIPSSPVPGKVSSCDACYL